MQNNQSRVAPCLSSEIEVRQWAIRILDADTIEEKLFAPAHLTDLSPGPPMIWEEPRRPQGMGFKTKTKEERLPPFQEHNHPEKIAICLHRFAGHELLAVEIMAYALLRFPDAPHSFRRGLINTLKEEQIHVRLYMERLKELEVHFGDLPLYKHFWHHTPYLTSAISYVSTMSLTFEMANLDFAPMYGQSFARNGDQESAALMLRILKDEISHVAFGWNWLKKLKQNELSEWDAWKSTISPLLTPKRARGFVIHEEHRRKAGISPEWIDTLKKHKDCP